MTHQFIVTKTHIIIINMYIIIIKYANRKKNSQKSRKNLEHE
jgi:hypothetical protein